MLVIVLYLQLDALISSVAKLETESIDRKS